MTAVLVTAAMIAMAICVFSGAIPNVCPPDESSTMRFPHECFCDEYYECSRGERVRRDCPAGNLFDQASGSCVSSGAADFSHCEGWEPPKRNCPPYGETTLPHETDCSSYYRCKDGHKTLSHCKGGLYYDEVKGLCTWQNSLGCARKIVYNLQISDGSPLIPKAVDLVCPSAGSNRTVRLPHPCRCDLYYDCVNGNAIYQECPKGLEFDYVKEICDDPSNFQCVRPIPSTNTTTQAPTTTSTTQASTTTSTTQAPTTTSTTSTTQAPTTTSTTQAPTTTSTTQVPTTTSTTSTTQAPTTTSTTQAPTTTSTTQAPTTTSTTSTTQAPTTTSTTQAPTTTSTTSSTQAPTTTSTTQAPTTTSTTQAPTTTSTTPAPTTPSPIPECPRNCPHTVRLPNPANCSSYYECRRGTRTLLWCPTGLRFNKSTQMCDWPWAVEC